MQLRELDPTDAGEVLAFFAGCSPEERTFFWDELTDPAVVDRWLRDDRRAASAVFEGERIVAFAAFIPATEWSSHVAELVLVVAESARRKGYGRALARAMLLAGLGRRFTKVNVQVTAERPGPIAMFTGIGFQVEALLRDQLRNPATGQMHDLVILSHLVDETYATLLTAGLDTAAG